MISPDFISTSPEGYAVAAPSGVESGTAGLANPTHETAKQRAEVRMAVFMMVDDLDTGMDCQEFASRVRRPRAPRITL